jgi:hypothetical protein
MKGEKTVAGIRKRLPGESNAQYQARETHGNPNARFLGTLSIFGGGDPSIVLRAVRGLVKRLDRRLARRPGGARQHR